MIELPESVVLANQIGSTVTGKMIERVTAAFSPHKFAWFHGDPEDYPGLLENKKIDGACSRASMVEVSAADSRIVMGDGANVRYHAEGEKRPKKHQLLLEFDDDSALSGTVQMYGGFWCFPEGEFDNKYYLLAKEKPTPLTAEFDKDYFFSLVTDDTRKLSAKAFLATEQRIPGLGNGVLQDILFNARIHPKYKIIDMSSKELDRLFLSIKETLDVMTKQGGRDTEKDLFGQPGGYRTKMSRNTVEKPCPECGSKIIKESFMGGTIYYCPGCQDCY
jgi:formamidopyrimidine-DNA glycosylase